MYYPRAKTPITLAELAEASANASDVVRAARLCPPRVQRGVDDHPSEEAVRPLIVRIRVRSLINAWSAVCLVLIC
jgi:hypothetical protein